MSSAVQICNMALLRVGGQTISALTDTSREAQILDVFYDQCLSQILRAYPWNFARKRATLALQNATAPTNWTYSYTLPVDYLQVREVVIPGLRVPRTDQKIPFEVGVLDGVKSIFCDVEDAELDYICLPDESLFDPAFSSALAWLLASEIASPLMGKPDLAQASKQAYLAALSEAISANLNEQSDQPPQSEFLDYRGVVL